MSDAPKKRLLLVDGSGYIFRAFFALPPMTRSDGTPVNAVFGFCSMLMKLLQERPHDDLVIVFDAGRKTFRNDLYEAYKANRDEPPPELVPQFELIRDAARAFGLPVAQTPGFEADDLIATYARLARERGEETVIVSSDKDLMQLVADGVAMWDPIKQKEIGRAEVMERFGVAPELVRDVLSLAGDTSDNVPGVPGIGVKTAAQLITQYGSLEQLLLSLDQIKQPKRRQTLEENADKARLSYTLVGLDAEAPLPFGLEEAGRKDLDAKRLLAFLQENGFRALITRVEAVAAEAAAGQAPSAPGDDRPTFEAITTLEALDALIAKALDVGHLALDTETTSLDVSRAELVGICLAVDPMAGFYVPLAHLDDFGQPRDGQLDRSQVLERLKPILLDPSVLKIGHNIKYDQGVLAGYGVAVARSTTRCSCPTCSTAPATATAWTRSPSASSTTTRSPTRRCAARVRPRSASPRRRSRRPPTMRPRTRW